MNQPFVVKNYIYISGVLPSASSPLLRLPRKTRDCLHFIMQSRIPTYWRVLPSNTVSIIIIPMHTRVCICVKIDWQISCLVNQPVCCLIRPNPRLYLLTHSFNFLLCNFATWLPIAFNPSPSQFITPYYIDKRRCLFWR